jgi:hypothetical protein
MKIDLRTYAKELTYWIDAFRPFVDNASRSALARLQEQLENGRDNLRTSFEWKLAAPIRTKIADRYDGPDKTPHKIKIGWQFECKFNRLADSKKSYVWTVSDMVTHIRIYSASDDAEILHFHYDLKNNNQLGPHVHMQFSEHYMKSKGRIPIAVPRFPSATMLPTDCLDLVLSEFFPYEWPQAQSGSQGLTTLQAGQRNRLVSMSQALLVQWKASPRKTPIAATQNCVMQDLQIA